ncbi:MAG: hypothetical protein ACYC6A_27085 [Armatimonadota bacterium]
MPGTRQDTKAGILISTVSTLPRPHAARELTDTPLPFLDWSLVETGMTNWAGERKEPIPASEARDYDESGIVPVQVGIPSGVRIMGQPATKAGRLFREDYAWESGLYPGSSVMLDDDIYRLWYYGAAGLLYAQSADGVNWTRPLIDFVPYASGESTNLLPPMDNDGGRRLMLHEGCVFKDLNGRSEDLYKAVFSGSVTAAELEQYEQQLGLPASAAAHMKKKVLFGAESPDGLCWRMLDRPLMLHPGDGQVSIEYDPGLKRYIGFFQGLEMGRRVVARAETEDFRRWPLPMTVLAPGPGDEPATDYLHGSYASYPGIPGIKLLFLTVYDAGRDRAEIRLAVSRDSVSWHLLPGGSPIPPGEPDAFDECGTIANTGLLSAADGSFAQVYSGCNRPLSYPKTAANACRLGCAWWPAERLAALEAPDRGEFTTVQLRLRGTRVLLNLQTERTGEARVEIRDSHFRPVAGRTFADGDSISGDHSWIPVTWRGDSDLTPLKGHAVYLRFRLRAAKVFAIKAGP